MDRPVTSKSRGICHYYNTARGCYAGHNCKFLHGAEERLTPYDKSKVCRYYVQGHCTKGEHCWFRHELKDFDESMCSICFEKPTTYGLLTGCGHAFCLQCIREWRDPQGKPSDMVMSGVLKRCPLCRSPSRFTTPSTRFFPHNHPFKQSITDKYMNSMARVPCKYFVETSAYGKPCCPFGVDCFYQHMNLDGTPHVFRHGADHFMKVFRRQQRQRGREFFEAALDTELADHFRSLSGIDGATNNLHVALNFFRRHLPAIWNSMAESGTTIDPPAGERNHEHAEDHQSLELLAQSLAAEWSLETTLLQVPPVNDGFDPDDGSAFSPAESPVSVPTASIPARARSVSPPPTTQVDSRPNSSVEASGPLPHSFLPWVMPRTPSPRPPSISPATATSSVQQSNTSRFSTVLNSRRETMIIDISDEDGDEGEENLVSCAHNIYDNEAQSPSTSTVFDPREGDASPSSLRAVEAAIGSTGRPQCEHDKDPPFVTDGRGRVVWSRTGRASQAQVQVERGRRAPSPAIKAREGRGRVVLTGREGCDACGGDSDTEMDCEGES